MSTNEPKWTTGPWQVIACSRGYIVEDAETFYDIAVVRDIGRHDNEANANLIAAAPDLYEALKELADFYRFIWDRVDGAIVLMPDRVEEFEQKQENARAALSKALG